MSDSFDEEALQEAVEKLPPPFFDMDVKEPREVRPFECSDEVAELFTAIAKAQAAFHKVESDKENTHFRAKYASIGAYLESIRKPLGDNGLAIIQFPRMTDAGTLEMLTVLTHESGQWLSNWLEAKLEKPSFHGLGQAITYLRRYSMCAILGLGQYDEDAQSVDLDTSGGALLSNEQAKEVWDFAEQHWGDGAGDELAKTAKLLFRVDGYTNVESKHFDTLMSNLKNKAAGK